MIAGWKLDLNRILVVSDVRSASLLEEGEQLQVGQAHRALGKVYGYKGETEKAIDHFEVALGIASPQSMRDQSFGVHLSLTMPFSEGGKFYDACLLARASWLQARLWA